METSFYYYDLINTAVVLLVLGYFTAPAIHRLIKRISTPTINSLRKGQKVSATINKALPSILKIKVWSEDELLKESQKPSMLLVGYIWINVVPLIAIIVGMGVFLVSDAISTYAAMYL